MRVTTLLILVISLHLCAKTTAQKITLSSSNISIEQFFNQLEKQTGYSFLLENGVVSKDEKISVNVKDASLEMVLDQILKPIKLSYKIENKIVYVQKVKENQMVPFLDNVPPGDIHGRVTDSLGNPLVGASITIKGSKKGVQTDVKGDFVIKDAPENAVLVVSYTGFVRQELKPGVDGNLHVQLQNSNNPLDQVQIIAYGTTTQRLSTGDVTTVTSKEIEQQPVSNPLAALEGRIPGLFITQTTGVPGGGFSIQLRGINSIANNNNPFYVIDGVPYISQITSNGAYLINDVLQGGNPLNYINPYDIESIEILKDADATAIYGSRAANGAILIVTKKGKAGRMQIDLNVNSGFQEPARDIKLLNTQQYLAMRHEAFDNDGAMPNPNADFDLTFWDTTRYTNWSKVLTGQTAHYNNFQGSVSGGSTNTQYFFGAGYGESSTPFPTLHPGDGIDQKASVHFNLNTQSTDKRFKLSFTGSYVSDKNTVQSEDFSTDRLELPPDAPPLFNPDGSLNWAPLVPGQTGTWTNPYSNLNVKYNQTTSNLIGNTVLSYGLLPNWEIKSSFGYTLTNIDEIQASPTTAFDPGFDETSGNSTFNVISTNSWIIEPQTNYKLQLSKGIFTALLGCTFQQDNSAVQKLNASNFVSDALIENPGAAGSISVNSTSSEYRYDAIFGRLNYNWEDKYIFNVTARRDGSSRFGPGRQFGNFGAVGGAWIFSKENLIQKNLPFLSFGKLRASYGTTGNDGIANYQYFDLYSTTYSPYGGTQGLYPINLSNPDLAWELTRKLEGGVELGVLKDRITIQASFYRNRSNNQLVNTPVSLVTGFGSIPANLPALVQNTGKEFVINTVNVKSRDFTWSSSFNLSISRNKLIAFPNLASSSYQYSLKIGQSLSTQYLYHMQGINDTTGVYQFTTSKGLTTYTPNFITDRSVDVTTLPKFFGGLQNSLKYKSLTLDFLFQFVKQTGQNLLGAYFPMPGTMYNIPVAFLNRWQNPGDQAKYEKFSQEYSSSPGSTFNSFQYAQQSDFAYSDASFIRLKNVVISWQFPDHINRKLHLQNARIYLQGQNLLTFTHYNGIDPESQGVGLPPMRVFTAGFQVTL